MSRVGSMPITVPNGVNVSIGDGFVNVSGAKGSISVMLHRGLKCILADGVISLGSVSASSAIHGTCRSNINNAVFGVSAGVVFNITIIGVGYKAEVIDGFLVLYLGYSHDIRLKVPSGLVISCPKPDRIVVEGCDIRKVSSVSDIISRFRKYNPYKGKGVIIKHERGGFLLKKEANKKK